MLRQQIARQARLFSTTPIARKSPVETIKDAAKVVDRTISNAAVKGIEKGEDIAGAVKEAIPETTGEAKGQAASIAGAAKGKVAELKGQAKGKASELQGEAKKKANAVDREASKKL